VWFWERKRGGVRLNTWVCVKSLTVLYIFSHLFAIPGRMGVQKSKVRRLFLRGSPPYLTGFVLCLPV
jgi:hypothetical protein